ncbi:thioredoxin family protein [Pontibacter chitinilyticus]|uniref:thioredoxin family protein n=1 Tax=Pontibacter chitinilyticus TaxID=2674989 RepID=UPI00321B5547
MPIVDKASDEDLRSLVYKYEYVIVKFVDEKCPVCKKLAPFYKALAEDIAYKGVLFLRMNASENPVSRNEVRLTGTPFIAIYRKGMLQECGLVKTAEELKGLLDKLLIPRA